MGLFAPGPLRKTVRAFSVSVVLRTARLTINLVLTSLLARQIGREGLGNLMVAMAIVGILLCIVEMGMQGIVQRELALEAGGWQTAGSVFFTRLVLGCLFYAGLLAYAFFAPGEQKWLMVIYGSLLITHGTTILGAWLSAKQQMESVAWAQFIGFLASAAAITAGICVKAPLWYFAATYVLECWVSFLATALIYQSRGGHVRTWRWSFQRAKSLAKESWFELASQLALLLLFRLDTVMVQALRGADEAGTYGAAVRVSEVIYFIPSVLASACLPALATLQKQDAARYRRRIAEYLAFSLVLSCGCAALLVCLAPPLVRVLFGRDFSGSAPILTVHAWAFIPFAIGTARTVYFTVEKRLWVNLPSVLLALALNTLLNWFWIPTWGGIGAAWATLIAYWAAWVASSFLLPAARDVPRLLWQGLRAMPSLGVPRRAAFSRTERPAPIVRE